MAFQKKKNITSCVVFYCCRIDENNIPTVIRSSAALSVLFILIFDFHNFTGIECLKEI